MIERILIGNDEKDLIGPDFMYWEEFGFIIHRVFAKPPQRHYYKFFASASIFPEAYWVNGIAHFGIPPKHYLIVDYDDVAGEVLSLMFYRMADKPIAIILDDTQTFRKMEVNPMIKKILITYNENNLSGMVKYYLVEVGGVDVIIDADSKNPHQYKFLVLKTNTPSFSLDKNIPQFGICPDYSILVYYDAEDDKVLRTEFYREPPIPVSIVFDESQTGIKGKKNNGGIFSRLISWVRGKQKGELSVAKMEDPFL